MCTDDDKSEAVDKPTSSTWYVSENDHQSDESSVGKYDFPPYTSRKGCGLANKDNQKQSPLNENEFTITNAKPIHAQRGSREPVAKDTDNRKEPPYNNKVKLSKKPEKRVHPSFPNEKYIVSQETLFDERFPSCVDTNTSETFCSDVDDF